MYHTKYNNIRISSTKYAEQWRPASFYRGSEKSCQIKFKLSNTITCGQQQH